MCITYHHVAIVTVCITYYHVAIVTVCITYHYVAILSVIFLAGKGDQTAEEYFQHVMKSTNTVILWPSKLKIGAKSKKG